MSMIEDPVITAMERDGCVRDHEPVYICEECGAGIDDGHPYWEIEDKILCESCAKANYRKIA